MKYITPSQACRLHEMMAEQTGGLHGLRDAALLESALYVPFAAFGDQEAYPSVNQKAAALAHGLIRNHPFADGNKRMGILLLLIFLHLNGQPARFTDDELIHIGWGLASGEMNLQAVYDLLDRKLR